MPAARIGDVARATGVAPSAIRYYERAGLLPPAARRSGRRQYGPETIGRVRIIVLARQAGLTIAETRTFLAECASGARPADGWRSVASAKLEELDARLARIAQMKELLGGGFRCHCRRIEDCERSLASAPASGRLCASSDRRSCPT